MTVRLTTLPNELRGGAWPSPVRAVRYPVKSGNERDPHLYLPPEVTTSLGTLKGPPSIRRMKERAKAGQYAPKPLGYAGCNGMNNGL